MEYVSVTWNTLQRVFQGLQNNLERAAVHLHDHIIPHARNGYQPHILHHRAMGLFALLLFTMKISVLIASGFSVAGPAYSSAITPEKVLELTNLSRQDYGVAPLTHNSLLAVAAQNKANDMLTKSYFAHTSPQGISPWYWIQQTGYSYITAGENLAINFREAEDVGVAWMNSPGHKANIVNKYFEDIGIGIAQGVFEGHDTIFVVQMFGATSEQPIAVKHEPTEVAKPAAASAQPTPEQIALQPKQASRQVQKSDPGPALQPISPQQPPAEELKILKSEARASDNVVHVSVHTSTSAVQVLVSYGNEAVFLKPLAEDIWIADIPLSILPTGSLQVKTKDIKGTVIVEQIAGFSNAIADNYRMNVGGSVHGESVKIFGRTFQPKVLEHNFYLLFIATLLTCLAIAIGVHRHVQHVQLVANTSFVAVLALLMWIG